jgi:hypothetical protein
MFFGSASWFYACAAWLREASDQFLAVANEIDERNGVIPPVPESRKEET